MSAARPQTRGGPALRKKALSSCLHSLDKFHATAWKETLLEGALSGGLTAEWQSLAAILRNLGLRVDSRSRKRMRQLLTGRPEIETREVPAFDGVVRPEYRLRTSEVR